MATRTGALVSSNSEQWRDDAGSLPILAIRSHRCLHASWRKSWEVGASHGRDFRRSRSGGGTEPAAARRLQECGRATARRRGQFADLGYPVTPMVAHMVAEHVTIARRLSDVGTKRIVLVSRCSGRTSISHLNFACSGCMRGVHHRGELRAMCTSARWSTRSIFNHRSCAGCRSQIARVPERHGVTRG